MGPRATVKSFWVTGTVGLYWDWMLVFSFVQPVIPPASSIMIYKKLFFIVVEFLENDVYAEQEPSGFRVEIIVIDTRSKAALADLGIDTAIGSQHEQVVGSHVSP